jgi:FtsZ-binding cell division protein ZapB
MQNYEDIIRRLTEENRRLQDRLDIALNTIALQQEEIQQLKNEIATLKGQKPRPKIPPSALEGPQSKDKQEDKKQNVQRKTSTT